jgi:OOP family OmpA-OmpF porin
MSLRAALAGMILLVPSGGLALTLEFPAAATVVADRAIPQDSRFVATGPFDGKQVDGVVAEGAVRQQSWKVGAGGLTTLQLLAPLRTQLEQAGYKIAYECEARRCGGFDFRYRLNVLPEPEMHINLGDYRYLAAQKDGDGGTDYVSLIVSRSLNAGFVQLTQIGGKEPVVALTASAKIPDATVALTATDPIGTQLETLGHATLDDLTFKTGSSALGDESFASLSDLAGYLKNRPDARVVLVGHTDAEGALDSNIALSRKRAAAVVARLVGTYGVPRRQVSADGVGYLSPRASNLTDEGRTQNRRVEVILTSTK